MRLTEQQHATNEARLSAVGTHKVDASVWIVEGTVIGRRVDGTRRGRSPNGRDVTRLASSPSLLAVRANKCIHVRT